MMVDDNKQGALPTIHMAKPCMWRFNNDADYQRMAFEREGLFYGCIIMALQWNRAEEILRVYIDARGESDLRHPVSSSIRTASEDGASAKTFRPGALISIHNGRGHYKGYLAFNQRHFQHDGRYKFCYANLFHTDGDYETIPVLASSLGKVTFDHYTLNETLFENETIQDEVARWNKVLPEGFLDRRAEWWT